MSAKGYVEALINRLPEDIRASLRYAFEHVIDQGQIGGIEHQEKAINFRFYRLDARTSTNANEEFSIAHGLGSAPYHLLPLVPLTSSGMSLPRLTVTRPADATRIYLSSPDTGVRFSVLAEV